MFGSTRWNPFDDIFSVQREMDRVFTQFWNDLPARTAGMTSSFHVNADEDAWRIDVPLPGIDPARVNLEVAGHTVTIRVEAPGDKSETTVTRSEQTFNVPEFLDLEKITASHKHGMLVLTLPLKDRVKPRRVAIEGVRDQKQLNAVA